MCQIDPIFRSCNCINKQQAKGTNVSYIFCPRFVVYSCIFNIAWWVLFHRRKFDILWVLFISIFHAKVFYTYVLFACFYGISRSVKTLKTTLVFMQVSCNYYHSSKPGNDNLMITACAALLAQLIRSTCYSVCRVYFHDIYFLDRYIS